MPREPLSYDEQLERVAGLIEEIARAHATRDFGRLTQLGNRLATDCVIAGALARDDRDQGAKGSVEAA